MSLLIGVPAFFLFYKAPTCFDAKQNGGERGIDCGGKCARLCPLDFAAPRVLWSYSMRVVPNVYNAIAYVQNPNQAVEAKAVSYIFKLYDIEGLLITQKTGYAFVPAGQKFAVFEGGVNTGVRIPARTTFEFTETAPWRRGDVLMKLKTDDIKVNEGERPSARAVVKNIAVDETFSNIDAVIVLYDKDDNRVAFSKTVLEKIGADETQEIFFTWQEPFLRPIVRTEVLYMTRPTQ